MEQNLKVQDTRHYFDEHKLLRRVRKIMANSKADLEDRLQKIVAITATEMAADVCSVYLLRSGFSLELVATYGLDQRAVHVTRLAQGEGVVGYVAETGSPLSLSSIIDHPNFKLKPETGEDKILGGFAAVPIIRENKVLGVLMIQSRLKTRFLDTQVEAMQNLAMIMAEILVGFEWIAIAQTPLKTVSNTLILKGIPVHLGLAQGGAVLHEQKFDVPRMISDNPQEEMNRFEKAMSAMQKSLKSLLEVAEHQGNSDQVSILEAFQMLAKDKGWSNKIKKLIKQGLTAEAAAQKVLSDMRLRIHAVHDFYMRERLWDFEDLTYRFVQHLQGNSQKILESLDGIVLVARTMGPADLLDYQKYKVKAVLLEEGMQTAHVAVLARSLNIPIIGQIPDLSNRVQPGDLILVDAREGKTIIRPTHQEEQEFLSLCQAQKKVQAAAKNCLQLPALTTDGIHVDLYLNAGLISDLEEINKTLAEGCGLYRTEVPFMMQKEFPEVDFQIKLYKELYARMEGKPIIFRTLDIGGDKVLPYFRRNVEENPMLGWRAIRIGLDRPMLLRKQVRAMMRAAEGKVLHIMFPMVSIVQEFIEARAIVESERMREESLGYVTPLEIKYGAMVEVPALVAGLDALLPKADFISVGTNDLFQFFFACDRGNPYIAHHYDTLSPAFLSLLQEIRVKAEKHKCPISVCGEMAGRPLDALALLGLGYRRLSMPAAAIAEVKMMIRSLNLNKFSMYLERLLSLKGKTIRNELKGFSRDNQIII